MAQYDIEEWEAVGLMPGKMAGHDHKHTMLPPLRHTQMQDPLGDLFDNLMRRIATAKDRNAALDEIIAFARAEVAEKTRQTLANEQREKRWSDAQPEMWANDIQQLKGTANAAQRFKDKA